MLTYISNSSHYKEVLSRVQSVKHTLWIGTADIKDLYVEVGKDKKPFLALIAQLIRRGVEVRLIHAKEPGPNFREDFDKYPVLYDRMERVLCPRVHFKMLVFDGKEVYVGSANLTGAGNGIYELNLVEYNEDWRTNQLKRVGKDDLVFLFRSGGWGYMGVFRVYQMDYPDYEFYDTLCVSRRLLPDLENHQLQTVAAACGYELENHHHALADAEACAWIAREIL